VADRRQNDPGLLPFVLSGGHRGEVREQAANLLRRQGEAVEPGRLASQLADRAGPFPYRAVVLSPGGDDLSGKLDALVAGRKVPGLVAGEARNSPRVAFVFPPLRAEYAGVGTDLLAHPSLRRPLQACGAALSDFVEWSPEDVLREEPGGPPFERMDVSQPLLFAISVALTELWRSAGVEPDAVIGHSVGEIAAAVSCGALSLHDAARVVATWGRSSMRMEGTGRMISLPLAAEAAEERISDRPGRLWIAAMNTPTWTAVSGENEATQELLDDLAEDGVHGRTMGLPAPGHSPLMEPIDAWFAEELTGISPCPGGVPFYSTVSGDRLDTTELDASYWSANLRQPVLFAPTVRALMRDAHDVFVEIGPRPVLTTALEEIVGDGDALVLGTLEQSAPDSFLDFLARIYVRGVDVEWPRVCETSLPLPVGSRPQARSRLGDDLLDSDLLDLVLGEVASAREVSSTAVDPDRPFKDLGFDSAAAVELRNVLNQIAGLALPTTLAFDYPTPRAVAEKMRLELEGDDGEPVRSEDSPLDDLALSALVELVLDEGEREP
jgi:acyl transferase domain-containing protein/acyl carrier protein